jgi:hypothetical protein
VVGSRFRINLLLATGGAVSTDTSGIAGVIELGLMTGDAFEAQNGLSESIELSLTTGEAFGGITGLHESIELVLDAGAAASTSGISGVLDLALITGPGSVASALGINEEIDLALTGGAAIAKDPNFASVSLLLPMDGANGSTTFTDASLNTFSVTANGDAQISTAQSVFGGASGLFDGNGDFLSVAANSAFELTGDFTIEGWIRASSFTVNFPMIVANNRSSFSGTGSTAAVFIAVAGSPRTLNLGRNDATGIDVVKSTTTINTNTWYYFAVTRSGSTVRLFLNGTLEGTGTNSSTWNFSSNGLNIGRNGWDGAQGFWYGYIDDLRITKGVARYTASFTPPAAPFPTS